MNERNVAALALALFQEQATKPNDHITYGELRGSGFELLARRLAARGVLVPSALTDEEAGALAADRGELPSERDPEHTTWFRAELERIAKGDAYASKTRLEALGAQFSSRYPGGVCPIHGPTYDAEKPCPVCARSAR